MELSVSPVANDRAFKVAVEDIEIAVQTGEACVGVDPLIVHTVVELDVVLEHVMDWVEL